MGKITTQSLSEGSVVVRAPRRNLPPHVAMAKKAAVLAGIKRRYEKESLVGHMYGRLYVESFHSSLKSQRRWNCRCLCGKWIVARTGALRYGHVKSCGCLQRESVRKKNMNWDFDFTKQSTGMYTIWQGMIRRCTKPSCAGWKDYGGRGIKVCDRWAQSFENFYRDIGPRPAGMSLDRIDNNGNYEPRNCRWATVDQQINNRRSNRFVSFLGLRLTIAQWSYLIGAHQPTLRQRIETLPTRQAFFSAPRVWATRTHRAWPSPNKIRSLVLRFKKQL